MTIPRMIAVLAAGLFAVAVVEEHDDLVRSGYAALFAFVIALALAVVVLLLVYAARRLLGHSAPLPWPVSAIVLTLAGLIVCPVFTTFDDGHPLEGGGCSGHVPLLAHLTAGADRHVAASYWQACSQ